jgi:uncharacterized membrane protein
VSQTAAPAAKGPIPPRLSGARQFLGSVARPWLPECVFAGMALAFGLAFLVLTPPFQVADEEAHFRRAFEISEGRIIALKRGNTTGDELPPAIDSLYDRFKGLKGHLEEKTSADAIRDSAEITLSSGDRAFLVFSNSAVHPPLTYLPQALGIFMARWFSSSVLVCLYAGRALNLLATVALTVLAIRLTPTGKWAFVLLALTPMSLSLAASLSPDAMTNALSFLLLAQVFAYAVGDERLLPSSAVARIAVLGAGVGLAKQMYFLLPLAYLMIPVRRLGSRRRYLASLAAVMAATFLAVAAWSLVVRHIWSPADPAMGMDPGEQFRGMLAHPVAFLRVLVATASYAPDCIEEYVGLLGWAEVHLPVAVCVTEVGLLILVCACEFGPRSGATAKQAFIAAAVAALVALTVAIVIHLTWDKVGAAAISWHGRYFIPISPLIGVALGRLGYLLPIRWRQAVTAIPGVAIVAVPVLLAASLMRLHDRYYVDTPWDAAERHSIRGRNLIGKGGAADLESARQEFEEAVRIYPSHAVSRNSLGLMLKDSDPDQAIEHFRTVLRTSPEDSVALFELANVLASRAEFPEAIRLYREALRVSQGNPTVATALRKTLEAQTVAQRDLQRISREIQEIVKSSMLEERARGTPVSLKRNRGPVTANSPSGLLTGLGFYWRIPPPSGRDIGLVSADEDALAPRRLAFYACSTKRVFSKRVFVFPPPGQAELLADEAVSWYFQVRLSDLNPEEAERERAYRAQRGLRFPLATLPE